MTADRWLRLGTLVLLLGIALSGSPGRAQAPGVGHVPSSVPGVSSSQAPNVPLPNRPRFRGGVDLVALDVCVKDRDGRVVSGLQSEDFLILEGKTPQEVAFFSLEGRVPLAAVLLLDTSASMWGDKLEHALAAARAFIRELGPDDLVEIITFSEVAHRAVGFSRDRAAAEAALSDVSATGSTGLFEAVLVALNDLAHLRPDPPGEYRQAIVVLSDGEDTSSRIDFDAVLEEARRRNVLVYGVSVRTDDKGRPLAPLRELFQLAFDTGGRAVGLAALDMLAPVYQEISAELQHLYRLGYVSSNSVRDGRWRSSSVRVRDRDYRVRTRAGYYAPRPSWNAGGAGQ